MAPLGYFDPAGLCKKGDEATFRQLRAAELKHGRVAMMAAVGAVAQHYVKFPGFESVPSGLAASITGLEAMALWLCLPWLASWSLVLGRRATTRSQETLVTHWASASTTRNGGWPSSTWAFGLVGLREVYSSVLFNSLIVNKCRESAPPRVCQS